MTYLWAKDIEQTPIDGGQRFREETAVYVVRDALVMCSNGMEYCCSCHTSTCWHCELVLIVRRVLHEV